MTTQLSGRVTVYTNQVPFEADILRSNTYKMVDVSKLAQTVLGTGLNNSTLVSGLECSPVVVPGLQVTVGPGCLYSFQNYESTSYGIFPPDSNQNHKLYKQALNFDPIVLDTPAPTIVGNSIIYLIQGAFETKDENIVSRPYFNSANPPQPIYNDLSDSRVDKVFPESKPGVESPSPVPPSADPGFVPLYYVTVSYGQTSIIPANISIADGAPFITESLTQKIGYVSIRERKYEQYVSTGTANAIVVNPSPIYSEFPSGTRITVVANSNNSASTTLNVNSVGDITVKYSTDYGLVNLSGGEILNSGIYDFVYNGTNWILLNPDNSRKFYGASVTNGSITIPGTNNPVLLNFTSVSYDTNSFWDNTNKRFVVGRVGYYSFTSNIYMQGGGSTDGYLVLYKNGVVLARLVQQTATADFTLYGGIDNYASSSSDYYQLYGLCNGSSRVANSISFQIKYLGN